MQFENQFSVNAPIADVWAVLLDVERVAPCLPGAKVIEQTGDDAYVVGMRVKVGPITMEYKGNVEIVEKDEAAHRAVLSGSGREVRGQGAAEATAEMTLTDEGGATVATVKTDVKLSGRMASMGQGVIADVSKKLVNTFSENLQAMMAPAAVGAVAAAEPEATASPAAVTTPAAPGPALADGAAAGPGATATPPAVVPAPVAAAAPRPADDTSLPLMSIAGVVLMGRLRKPQVAVPLVIVVIALGVLIFWLVRH
jgi:carbon monoxide dehydrogenase subunit G